jgi:hypothetical protein
MRAGRRFGNDGYGSYQLLILQERRDHEAALPFLR